MIAWPRPVTWTTAFVHDPHGDRSYHVAPDGRFPMIRPPADIFAPGAVLNEGFAITPDHRTILYGAARAEADSWTVERSAPAQVER